MAENTRWFKDRYFIVFFGMMVIIVATIMSNPFLLTSQNEKIIDRIDDLQGEREEESRQQTKDILSNVSNVIVANQKRILDNLSHILMNVTNTTAVVANQTELLEDIIQQHANETSNMTVVVGEHTDAKPSETLYAELKRGNETTGNISALDKPIIID